MSNRFAALALESKEAKPPGSRRAKKKDRAAEHRASEIQQGHSVTLHLDDGAAYSLALAGDDLLVALEPGTGRRLASFAVAGAAQAADPAFLAFVHVQVQGQLRQQDAQEQQRGSQQQQQAEDFEGTTAGSAGGVWTGAEEGAVTEEEVDELLSLLLGGGGGSGSRPSSKASSIVAEEQSAQPAGAQRASQHNAASTQQPPDPPALTDSELAAQYQLEEDAALAASMVAEEEAAAAARAAGRAQASSAFGGQLQEAPPAAGRPGTAANPFPSLRDAAPGSAPSAATAEQTRQLLRRQHRSAKAAHLSRGSGVRLLNRGSAAASPVKQPQPQAEGGGPPPLQLGEGLRLHEDDLDYVMLLRDDHVTAAARAAADAYAERQEAALPGAAASAEAMRVMIDAAARRGSPGGPAGGNGGRPGSSAASYTGSAAGEEGGSAGDAAEEWGEEAAGPPPAVAVEPVDTKSYRRLLEDMRRRGWQLVGCAGGGHFRCERCFADLPGYKQVYFLSSTPSDCKYIWNVAAAIKRFDREVDDRRQAAAAEAAAAGVGPPGRQSR